MTTLSFMLLRQSSDEYNCILYVKEFLQLYSPEDCLSNTKLRVVNYWNSFIFSFGNKNINIYMFVFVHIYYNQCRSCGSALGALHFRIFQNWNCKNNNHFNGLWQNSSARKLCSDIFMKIKKITVTWDTWRSLCLCSAFFSSSDRFL